MHLRLALPGAVFAFAVSASVSAQDVETRTASLIDPDQRPAVEKLQRDFAAPGDPARLTATTRAVATLRKETALTVRLLVNGQPVTL